MSRKLVILIALAAGFMLGGCVVHEGYRHPRHRDVIVVVPEHPHHHWR